MKMKYEMHCNMDRLLKRNNIALLQPPTIACTLWVLVWPHHRPMQGGQAGQNLFPGICWVFAVWLFPG